MKKCINCNEIKSYDDFYLASGRPKSRCKECCGTKPKKPGIKKCAKCKEEKTHDMFYFRPNRYDVLVPTGYCKSCMGIKNVTSTTRSYNKSSKKSKSWKNNRQTEREIMEPTIREYIRRVIMRDYGINIVDIFTIIHYHQILWNYDNEPYEVINKELKRKWDNLENWYNTTI
jgi:hypothetical protein